MELIRDTADQLVGMRFANVPIPAGAHITRAYVQFETDETKTGVTTLLIQGQASDDAATFTTATKNISSRPRTVASVSWVPVAWSILQERGQISRRRTSPASSRRSCLDRGGPPATPLP